jgi:DNA-binding NtrC family response regulator
MDADITTASFALPEDGAPRLLLQLAGALESFVLPPQGTVTIGRSSKCDISVDTPDVSWIHAQLEVRRQQVLLRDKASEHGTFVRCRRLDSAPALLAPGEMIQFGSLLGFLQGTPTYARRMPPPVGAEAVDDMVRAIAPTRLTALLVGASGTGKEVCAQQLHRLSRRANAPFIKIDCASLSDAVLDAQPSARMRPGGDQPVIDPTRFIEAAHRGTIFLDEVGALTPSLQAKMLRFVEDGDVIRGCGIHVPVFDVRFIAATRRSLVDEVRQGRFRSDLFYRLAAVTIELPSLAARHDFDLIVAQVLATVAADFGRPVPLLSEGARARLRAHAWPGNIRELRHVLEQALLHLGGERVLGEEDLSFRPQTSELALAGASRHGLLSDVLAEPERIIAALHDAGGHQGVAAAALGISRGTLQTRMDRYGIPRPRRPN